MERIHTDEEEAPLCGNNSVCAGDYEGAMRRAERMRRELISKPRARSR